jgi:hypothetical protein
MSIYELPEFYDTWSLRYSYDEIGGDYFCDIKSAKKNRKNNQPHRPKIVKSFNSHFAFLV